MPRALICVGPKAPYIVGSNVVSALGVAHIYLSSGRFIQLAMLHCLKNHIHFIVRICIEPFYNTTH